LNQHYEIESEKQNILDTKNYHFVNQHF